MSFEKLTHSYNLCRNQERECLHPSGASSVGFPGAPPPQRQPPWASYQKHLVFCGWCSRILFKQNYTMYTLLCLLLVSFPQHNSFEIHPYCCLYYLFLLIPLYSDATIFKCWFTHWQALGLCPVSSLPVPHLMFLLTRISHWSLEKWFIALALCFCSLSLSWNICLCLYLTNSYSSLKTQLM